MSHWSQSFSNPSCFTSWLENTSPKFTKECPKDDDEEVEDLDCEDDLSSTEELGLPTPIKNEMDAQESDVASAGESPKPKVAKRSTSSSSLKADGPATMRSSYWTYVHDQQKKIKKEHPEMTPKDVLKMAREKLLISSST